MTSQTISKQSRYPIDTVSRHIAALFVAKLSPHGGKLSDALAAEYMEQTKHYPDWAVEQACQEFRASPEKFAPFPGELGTRCRQIAAAKKALNDANEADRREIRERIAAQARRAARTDEQRARVQRAHDEWKEAHEAYKAELSLNEPKQGETEAQRTHNRFAGQARKALIEKMGDWY